MWKANFRAKPLSACARLPLRWGHSLGAARASGLRPTVLRRKKQDVLKKREIRRDAPIA
jgi:hypothetical protein